jgi:hypothetical protein
MMVGTHADAISTIPLSAELRALVGIGCELNVGGMRALSNGPAAALESFVVDAGWFQGMNRLRMFSRRRQLGAGGSEEVFLGV